MSLIILLRNVSPSFEVDVDSQVFIKFFWPLYHLIDGMKREMCRRERENNFDTDFYHR